MSATNRGTVRESQDFYETPDWLTKALIPHLRQYQPRRVLEPAAGQGAIVRVLEQAFPEAVIEQGDIRTGQDFLTHEYAGPYDLIITNPPYRLVIEFIRRALALRAPHGAVVMLLRVNFLGSEKRGPWLRVNTPSLYVSSCRPDFTGGGGDATEYGWLVWDGKPPTLAILPTEGCKRRRQRTSA